MLHGYVIWQHCKTHQHQLSASLEYGRPNALGKVSRFVVDCVNKSTLRRNGIYFHSSTSRTQWPIMWLKQWRRGIEDKPRNFKYI